MSSDERDVALRVDPDGRVWAVAEDGSERQVAHLRTPWVKTLEPNPSDRRGRTLRLRWLRPGQRHSREAGPGAWGSDRYLLRPDVADPADWTVLPDGRLRAPDVPGKKRLTYGRDTRTGQRVLARLEAAGLPTEPTP